MQFTNNKRSNIFQVDQFFAKLLQVKSNNNHVFEFTYEIDQVEAIKNDLTIVRIRIFSRDVSKNSIFDGKKSNSSIVESILKQSQNSKTRAKQQEEYTILLNYSDVTAKLKKSIISAVKRNDDITSSLTKPKVKTVPVHETVVNNEKKPLLQFIASDKIVDVGKNLSSSLNLDTKFISHQLLRNGVDPSSVLGLTHRSISSKQSFEGIVRVTKSHERETDSIVQLMNSYILGNNREGFKNDSSQIGNDSVHVRSLSTEVQKNVQITTRVSLPGKKMSEFDASQLFVRFEALNAKTMIVDAAITMPLNVTRHVKLLNTAFKPPAASIVSTRAISNLHIKQIDPNADTISVYRKNVTVTNIDPDSYELIRTYPLSHNQEIFIPLDKPSSTFGVYRILANGEGGYRSAEFTNVVSRPERFRSDKAISLITGNVATGVEIMVSEFPPALSHVEVLVRNVTRFERDFRIVGSTVLFIDDQIRNAGAVTIIDTQTIDYEIYEYCLRLTYKNGVSELSTTSIIEKLAYHPNKVDINISNVDVIDEEGLLNVRFNMSAKFLDNDVDVFKTLLEKRGIKDLFTDEFKTQRGMLNDVFVFVVDRLNLTTGVRESFGTLQDPEFDDVKLRSVNSVEPLRRTHRYRYEVSIALRSVETIFNSLKKTLVDPTTNKHYTMNPAKALHPITIRKGIVVTETGLKSRYSQNVFSHGRIGFYETLNVTFDKPNVEIRELSAERFDSDINIVNWKVNEAYLREIDHFIIMKDVHGVRTLVGKCHNDFEMGNFQFLHRINGHDLGELKYVVIMMFNDYSVSDEYVSNSVII